MATQTPRPLATQGVRKASRDGVFVYAAAVLNDGPLLLELKDAIREGDGEHILHCWKVMLLYFRYAGHTNYQREAFTLLALVNASASPGVASQLTWGRVVNTRGGKGHNVPIDHDLHMEHLNHTLKEHI